MKSKQLLVGSESTRIDNASTSHEVARQRSINILMVDDDADVLALVTTVLEKHYGIGCVDTTATLHTAAARIDMHDYDIVILDIDLPDGNGLVMLEQTYDSQPPWPVIVMSARRDQDTPFRTLLSGASHYLEKSINNVANLPALIQQSLREFDDRGASEQPA